MTETPDRDHILKRIARIKETVKETSPAAYIVRAVRHDPSLKRKQVLNVLHNKRGFIHAAAVLNAVEAVLGLPPLD